MCTRRYSIILCFQLHLKYRRSETVCMNWISETAWTWRVIRTAYRPRISRGNERTEASCLMGPSSPGSVNAGIFSDHFMVKIWLYWKLQIISFSPIWLKISQLCVIFEKRSAKVNSKWDFLMKWSGAKLLHNTLNWSTISWKGFEFVIGSIY